jgi:oligoendopeptidase F
MDYKGYNIGIHEFGHNVEQTISLHEVDNYFMRGVPNTAFTEALAFTFQNRDLELLGLGNNDTINEDLNTLDIFWNCYEIMGVSLVDIKTWQWMYAHPKANAEQLRNAVMNIAKEVWNLYYAPIFKEKDQVILACYSHMIVDPLYLSAYPIGHLIDFQFEQYLKGKKIGPEVERIFAMGHLTPDLWLQRAVGQKLSTTPLLNATSNAVIDVANYDKQIKKERRETKVIKKKKSK